MLFDWNLKILIPNWLSIFIQGLLNSLVHCAMYSYYFISSYKPELKKSLWWKKYITQIQLIQFVLLFSYCTVSICFVDCPNPKIFLWFGVVQSVIMITMFSDFYYKAYIKKKALPWWACNNERSLCVMLKAKQFLKFSEIVILLVTFSTFSYAKCALF